MRYSMHVYYPDGYIWNVTKEYTNGLTFEDIEREIRALARNREDAPEDYPNPRYEVMLVPIA